MKILPGRFQFQRRLGEVVLTGLMVLAGMAVRADTETAKPVTTAEAETFARQLTKHFNQNDQMYYIRAFDFNALMEKGVPKEMQGDPDVDDFKRGMRLGLANQLGMSKSLRFLETTQMDGQCCVLMRMLLTNNTVNYQSLYLEHGANGIKINDVYVFLSATKLSDNVRHLVIPILRAKNASILDRMFGDKPDLVKYAPQWLKVGDYVRHGKYQEALDAYEELPDSLKRDKFLLVQRLQAAQRVSDAEYMATLKFWRETYPNDPAADLLSIDYYTLLKQYDKAFACIDRLDKAVGGDPWLDFDRAATYSVEKDQPMAEKFAKQAFEREPDLAISGLFAVSKMEQRGDYVACVKMLEEMHERGGYRITSLDRGLRVTTRHTALLNSDEYKKWFYSASPEPGGAMITPAKASN